MHKIFNIAVLTVTLNVFAVFTGVINLVQFCYKTQEQNGA